MMPAHYALSDAAIVLVTIVVGYALWRNDRTIAAFAMACFGIAAAIGVVRFGGNLQDELAAAHSGASQLLGLAGAFAAVAAYFSRSRDTGRIGIMALILCAATLIFLFAQPLLGPLLLLALAILIIAPVLHRVATRQLWLVPAGAAVMLANTLIIRRAPWLDEAVSWHAYHIIIAIALAALAKGLIAIDRSVPK